MVWKRPLGPFEISGKRYFHIRAAAQMIGKDLISVGTLSVWAHKGETPFGMFLDVLRQPLMKTGVENHLARSHRDVRLLLNEETILALKSLLNFRTNRRGPMPPSDFAALKEAAWRYNKSRILRRLDF